ncbi:VOC family protein [Evansella sp. AB-P1]|uniref:VOC family protein n=1 Tax=Evansella sp. AB-P1 TaxID=3037653 RepID=UPI00241CDAC9|nr:VOC family protein [Evansella sp. AB-P1]MDG5785994.1 VOC family protein [Evansella sp. AB-P1]
MSFYIKRIDHVQLAAPTGSERKARTFFKDILGFEEVEKPEVLKKRGGVWFAFGDYQLHIGIDADFSPAKKAHPAFEVDHLENLKEYLKDHGVVFEVDHHLPNANRIYVHDPFGNRLEFLEWDKEGLKD